MSAKNLFGKISWQYALGEVVFIFIGITSAIWFNNWNTSLKEKRVELNTIKEIRNALQQDLRDLNTNTQGFKTRIQSYEVILKYLRQKLPQDDTINTSCLYLLGYTKFLSNTGAYETLKSRGLETISNDSLRLKISSYYDMTCEWLLVNEAIYTSHHIDVLTPQLQKNFRLTDQSLKIIDYQKLLNNFDFEQVVSWQLLNEQNMLNTTQKTIEALKILIQQIKHEIKQFK